MPPPGSQKKKLTCCVTGVGFFWFMTCPTFEQYFRIMDALINKSDTFKHYINFERLELKLTA